MKTFKKLMENRKFSLRLIIALFSIKLITYYILIGSKVTGIFHFIITFFLFVNLFLGLALSNLKYKNRIFLGIYTGLSILMFADSMYYNYYHQTVSIKQIWQLKNVSAVPESLVATFIPASIFLLIDIPFVYYLFKEFVMESNNKDKKIITKYSQKSKNINTIIALAFFVVLINPFHSPAIAKVRSVEFFSNHTTDVFDSLTEDLVSTEISAEEVMDVVGYIQEDEDQNTDIKYHGIGANKNLILVQVEALQNFVINNEYEGQVLTPNLNQLIGEDSLYFDQYYSHIGKGNTVDAEFSTLNSLYPSAERECYTLYQDNTFYGLPWILKEGGYETAAFHGYKGDFWNREAAYPGQGIDEFYSMEDLDQSDLLGMGISDVSVFNQSIDIMKETKEPFFSYIITLTNHHPFLLPEELQNIDLLEEHQDTMFGNYLETVNYTDYAIGEFIEELKEADLYEDSIIVFYGDHHGLNYSMDDNEEVVGAYLEKPYYYDEMLNVPLIIHIPGSGLSETISTTGGFVDFLPTIANIMDLGIPHQYILGQDLVNSSNGFIAFTSYLFDGSFIHNDVMFEISREGILEGSKAWNVNTYESIDPLTLEDSYNHALTIKQTSKEILDQDLIGELELQKP